MLLVQLAFCAARVRACFAAERDRQHPGRAAQSSAGVSPHVKQSGGLARSAWRALKAPV